MANKMANTTDNSSNSSRNTSKYSNTTGIIPSPISIEVRTPPLGVTLSPIGSSNSNSE